MWGEGKKVIDSEDKTDLWEGNWERNLEDDSCEELWEKN